jgi:hypothetical protein
MASSQLDVSCPQCGNNQRVKKVSTVYAEAVGTGQVYSRSRERYVNREIVTKLGEKLAPPRKFASSKGYRTAILLLSTFTCGIMGIGAICLAPTLSSFQSFSGQSSGSGSGFSYAFLAMGICIFILWALVNMAVRVSTLAQDKRLEPIAIKAYEKWDQLYYCDLHDIAFIPGTNIVMPSDKVQEYVSWDAK